MLTEKEVKELIKEAMNDKYQGRYPEALDKFDAIIRELAESDKEWAKLKIGEAMHQLGVTLQNMGKDYKAALSCLWTTIAYRRAINDNIGLAYSYFQVPMCRLARGDKKEDVLSDFQNAKLRIQIAISLLKGTPEVAILGDAHHSLAYISQQEKRIPEAVSLYNEALNYRRAISEIFGERRGEGLTRARLAECYLGIGRLSDAQGQAIVAYEIFKKIGDVNRIKQVEKTLQEIKRKEN